MITIKEIGTKPLISRIAVKIVQHIRHHNLPEGFHLVEQKLADECQVSRSPVHKALVALAKKGVVRYKPNHGFFLARPASEIPELNHLSPVSIEEDKYYQIAGDRVRGRLKDFVTEVELRTRYKLSRDKLTKILSRMAREGWVERRPGKGWSFLPVLNSIDTLEQSFRFRIVVEPAALLEPTYKVDPILFAELRREQQEALLKARVDSTVYASMFEVGARFHEKIVACSGNTFFTDSVQQINRLRRLIEYNFKVDQPRLQRYREHLEILDLLESGHNQEAADLLRHHLNQAKMHRRQAP